MTPPQERPGGDLPPEFHQAEAAQQQQAGHRGEPVAFRDEHGHQRRHVQADRRDDPACLRPPQGRQQHSRQAQDRRRAEADARQQQAVFLEGLHHPQVVVGKGVPEVAQLLQEQPQPGRRVLVDVLAGEVRPERGNFRAPQWVARRAFGPEDGVAEHPVLVGVQRRGHLRIAVGEGIVADEEVDAAVRREEHRLVGQQVVVQRAGRRAQHDAAHQQRRRPRAPTGGEGTLCRGPVPPQQDGRQHEGREEQDVGHHHGHDAHQDPQPEERRQRGPAGPPPPQHPPHDEPERRDEVGRGHEHRRVGLRGFAEDPAQRRQRADRPRAPPGGGIGFFPRAGESQRAEPEEERGRAGFGQRLAEHREVRLITHDGVDERQPVGIARQSVECLVVRPGAGRDAPRPVAVELHVPLFGEEIRRVGRAVHDPETSQQRDQEHDPGRGGFPPGWQGRTVGGGEHGARFHSRSYADPQRGRDFFGLRTAPHGMRELSHL